MKANLSSGPTKTTPFWKLERMRISLVSNWILTSCQTHTAQDKGNERVAEVMQRAGWLPFCLRDCCVTLDSGDSPARLARSAGSGGSERLLGIMWYFWLHKFPSSGPVFFSSCCEILSEKVLPSIATKLSFFCT